MKRALGVLASVGALGLLFAASSAQAATLPSGFQESTVISGLSEPTAVRFSPDGRVFVAEKSGIIKEFDDLTDTTPTTVADLRTNVFNRFDRGMLGFELDPNFPANPYVYVLYAHDAPIGGTAPRWGTAGTSTDDCPVQTGGCVISGRLSRLQLAGNVATGPEQVLVEDWCQQYGSHSVGNIAFGPDGALYASGGDGASWDFADYGQEGNPCGDPPGGVGGSQTPPTAEGGALRAQDVRSHTAAPPPPSAPAILRPNVDITSQWAVAGGSGAAWDALDDNVTSPADVPVENFMYSGTLNQVTEVGLGTTALNGVTPTGGKAWFYGNVPANGAVKVDVVWGGSVRATTTVQGGANGAPYQWRSIDVTPPDQAAVDDLRLRFTVTAGTAAAGNEFAAYFELPTPSGGTTTPPTTGQATLRPNADVTTQWSVGGGGATWDAIDDAVTQPASVPVEKFIYAGGLNKTAEVGMTTQALPSGSTVTGGKAWFYNNVPANAAVKVDAVWNGAVQATTTIQGGASGASYQWRSLDVTPPNQAAVDDLRLRFTITAGSNSSANLFAAYFDLAWSTPGGGGGGGGGGGTNDPTDLNGAVIRVNPATGAGLPDNPLASSTDPNERRLVAYGFRNPYRFTVRPGTNELWVGDVGWNDWEEIDRVPNATQGPSNFGWPCYEGPGRQPSYDSADLNLCESLYAAPNVISPYFTYNHGSKAVPGESCPSGSSSLSGTTFYTGGGAFPASYQGALFFSDYSRNCIWVMPPGTNGLPDPTQVSTFASAAAGPVNLTFGPDGNLYYPDIAGGTVRQIAYTAANDAPTAVAEATPDSGPTPLSVQFDATASSDPDIADTLHYEWDLDGDGQYNDSTAAQPTRVYNTAGTYVVGLHAIDPAGHVGSATVTIHAGNIPPVANITAPSASTLWRVGQQINFAGTGTDAETGTLPASRFSWQLNLEHCPSNCHTHFVGTYPGVTTGSFLAPDHDYPSYLTLKLTVTDPGGLSDTDMLRLDPRTVGITMKSVPAGLQLTLDAITAASPFTATVIQGSNNSISAPSPQTKSGTTYSWLGWSDNGARTHNFTANANRTYTATYGSGVAGANGAMTPAQAKRVRKCIRKARHNKHKKNRCFVKFAGH